MTDEFLSGFILGGILTSLALSASFAFLRRASNAKPAARGFASLSGSASAASTTHKHDLFYQCESGQQLPIGESEDEPRNVSRAVQPPVSGSEGVEFPNVYPMWHKAIGWVLVVEKPSYGKVNVTKPDGRLHYASLELLIEKPSDAPPQRGASGGG